MGLIYKTSAWNDALWAGHCKASRSAQITLGAGSQKQPQFHEFAHDMHADLYLRHEPQRHGQAPEWATSLLDQAHDLAEWQTLRARCERNGFAAGVCTEAMLQALVPLLPEAPKRQRGQHGTQNAQQESGQGEGERPSSDDASTASVFVVA